MLEAIYLLTGLLLPLFYLPQIQKLRHDSSGLAAYSMRKAIAQLVLRMAGMLYVVFVNKDPYIMFVILADVAGRLTELGFALRALQRQNRQILVSAFGESTVGSN